MINKRRFTIIEILLGISFLSILLAFFVLYFNFAKVRAATSQAWVKEQIYYLCDTTAELIANNKDLTQDEELNDKIEEIDILITEKNISRGSNFIVESDNATFEYKYETPSGKYNCKISCSSINDATRSEEPAGSIVYDDQSNNPDRNCLID